jgi:hypothetical protein
VAGGRRGSPEAGTSFEPGTETGTSNVDGLEPLDIHRTSLLTEGLGSYTDKAIIRNSMLK